MRRQIILFALLLATSLSAQELTLASFNIRIFSTGSRDDAELALIADRLQQFDLIAIQELRDEEVVDRTLQILADRGHAFRAVISPPAGRGVKELYAFLYRPDKVQALGPQRLYPDPDDAFIREPFWASFKAGQFDFTLITIHAIYGDSKADRRAEAALLDDIYQLVQRVDPDEQDVIVLGDFNLPPDDAGFSQLDALLDPLFTGDIRTTISDASLYDNIWFDPEHVQEFTGQIGMDRFDETAFDNDDKASSLAVSDHRPIWATLGIPKQKGEKFHRVREPVPLQDELTNRGPLEPPLLFNNPHSPLPPPDPQE